MAVRWKDKPQLVDLAGTERIPATSMDGGPKVGGGFVAAEDDIHMTPDQIRAYARAIRVTSTITSNTITPAGDTDLLRALGLTAGLTIANPSATPIDGWGFVAYIEDNGTTRSLTWGSKFDDSEFASLPAATTAGKRHRLGFEYHAGDDKLYCMYAEVEA